MSRETKSAGDGGSEPAPSTGSGDGNSGAQPVYTRTGDAGETALRGGQRVSKGTLRVNAYGTVDELNAAIGWAREVACQSATEAASLAELVESLLDVQHQLFNLGSTLATLPGEVPADQPRVTEREIEALERAMDRCSASLPPLTSFVLPGGCAPNAALHVARTVCRRAERRCVQLARAEPVDASSLKYLNRLSDALFVWARFVAAELGAAETPWNPKR